MLLPLVLLPALAAAALPEIDPEHPIITPSPSHSEPSRTWELKRDLLSDAAGGLSSILGGLGSNLPSYVASGVPAYFQNFPTGTAVQKSLGIDDSQVEALPTQVLNLPPYGNYTDRGWQIRFRANVYKQPNISQSKLDDLANAFLVDTSIQSLPSDQAAQARNVTAEIFVIQQGHQNVTFSLATQSGDGRQTIDFPEATTPEGDIDGFAPIGSNGLKPGNATSAIQLVNIWTNGTNTGNATAYLVPETGVTVISDVDDVLRVTKIYQPKEGLLNSFARPYVPWENMPDIYANWSSSYKGLHFHYLTTLPEQVSRNYIEFLSRYYPLGSHDTRPLNFSDVSATLSIRKYLLGEIFRAFPKRKFILVGDVSNSDIMRDYPKMVDDFPGQVQCIFLRNTTATDDDKFPYDTSGFKGLNQSMYMFFVVPDDLTHLDLASGQCYNSSIKQNLTFGVQDIGLGSGSGKSAAGGLWQQSFWSEAGWLSIVLPLLWAFGIFGPVFA